MTLEGGDCVGERKPADYLLCAIHKNAMSIGGKVTMKLMKLMLGILMLTVISAGVGNAAITVFSDNFDGTEIDQTKWTSPDPFRYYQYSGPYGPTGYWTTPPNNPSYGTATASNSWLSLRNGYSTVFPCVESRYNPFPETGNFYFETKMRYDGSSPHGTGFQMRRADSDNPVENIIFSIWQDSGIPLSISFLGYGWSGMRPDLAEHVYRIEYVDGNYTLWIDGSKKAGPFASSVRPNKMWFGNPVYAWWGYNNWTNLSVDYVSVQKDNPPVPVANAGLDQTVYERDPVTLDASGSTPNVSYQWEQIAGTPVSLNLADTVHPTFAAPNTDAGGTTLTFQLTVSDGFSTSKPDIVNVTVKNVNHPPVAEAGNDQTVAEGSLVKLDGSNSYDVDGEALSYTWSQKAGPAIQLSHIAVAGPSFTTPLVGPEGAKLVFELSVTDGIDVSTDTVIITVENVNHQPVAEAGPDFIKNEGTVVELDGTASSDADLDSLSFQWSQVSGPTVVLSDPTNPKPTFTAPMVELGGETLVFQLIVSDGLTISNADQVTVRVLNVNDPPVCELARPVTDSLWPPNHKMTPVSIAGISDPNDDNVKITITRVTQDEPINGLGDGDTTPDASIQGAIALLRAERSGTGNGRVYHIHFTADDGDGGTCSGTVKVVVPHSKTPLSSALDEGELFDSTQN